MTQSEVIQGELDWGDLEIVTTNECPWCDKLLDYLKGQSITHRKTTLRTKQDRDAFKAKYADLNIITVPAVFENGEYKGGHDQYMKLARARLMGGSEE